ncbi:MAG: hypothetical protein H8E31_08390 [Planctomycetes bacterium]|nr:hypothetical protein [Planctomycetota bacterium]
MAFPETIYCLTCCEERPAADIDEHGTCESCEVRHRPWRRWYWATVQRCANEWDALAGNDPGLFIRLGSLEDWALATVAFQSPGEGWELLAVLDKDPGSHNRRWSAIDALLRDQPVLGLGNPPTLLVEV